MIDFDATLLSQQFSKTSENSSLTKRIQKTDIYELDDNEVNVNKKTNFIANPNYAIDSALNTESLSKEKINSISEGLYRTVQTSAILVNINKDYTDTTEDKTYITNSEIKDSVVRESEESKNVFESIGDFFKNLYSGAADVVSSVGSTASDLLDTIKNIDIQEERK